MFMKLFLGRIKISVRAKTETFWQFLFPLILGTFFFIAFDNISNVSEGIHAIPVAVVEEKQNKAFEEFLKAVSGTEDDALLKVSYKPYDQAVTSLKEEKVDAIIVVADTISMEIGKNGMNQTVIKSMLDQFNQTSQLIETVAKNNPEKLPVVLEEMTKNQVMNQEIAANKNKEMDPMIEYFYALIAMTCLFGVFQGVNAADSIQANASALGARRTIAPTNRLTQIVADFTACTLIIFLSCVVLLVYLNVCLGVHLSGQLPYLLLTCFAGSIVGNAMGILIGSLCRKDYSLKMGIATSSSLFLSFLAGLMVGNMKHIIEESAPIINRINPAALISNALLSLNIYDTHDQFFLNIGLLLLIGVIMCMISYFVVRRQKYASL